VRASRITNTCHSFSANLLSSSHINSFAADLLFFNDINHFQPICGALGAMDADVLRASTILITRSNSLREKGFSSKWLMPAAHHASGLSMLADNPMTGTEKLEVLGSCCIATMRLVASMPPMTGISRTLREGARKGGIINMTAYAQPETRGVHEDAVKAVVIRAAAARRLGENVNRLLACDLNGLGMAAK
jgi:hypothetical protein